MDTFFEQLVAIRKDAKTSALYFLIWFSAFFLIVLLFTILFSGLSFFAAVGLLYAAYWLSSKLNLEYEYIITNGSMDIDKIINKNSRKRILSFELANVIRLEKYNPSFINGIEKKTIIYACNADGDNVYFMGVNNKDKGAVYLVFSPDDRIKSAILKFAPKFITNSAFD